MFKNLFKKKAPKRESIFLAGWEVNLNGDEQCQKFIQTQITTEQIANEMGSGIELVFENDRLIEAYDIGEGDRNTHKLDTEEIGLQKPNFQPKNVYQFFDNHNGPHQIGGEIPNDFKLPENKCVVPFQYLGFISNEDPAFNWLPFKLHLTCPIFLNFDNLFLDYTDPSHPVILNKEEIESADTAFSEDLNEESEFIYASTPLEAAAGSGNFMAKGDAGIPRWIQYPTIPSCPKSGKCMQFVCQLNGSETKTKRTNVKSQTEFFDHYFNELNFWGDGDLFVFFEPDSKVACYFIQNT